MDQDQPTAATMSRRTAMKRAAIVGGSLVWTAPLVQQISMPVSMAETSPPPGGGGGGGSGGDGCVRLPLVEICL